MSEREREREREKIEERTTRNQSAGQPCIESAEVSSFRSWLLFLGPQGQSSVANSGHLANGTLTGFRWPSLGARAEMTSPRVLAVSWVDFYVLTDRRTACPGERWISHLRHQST